MSPIRRKLRIWSYLLKKSFMDNFIFLCSVKGDIDSKWVTQNCPEMFCEKVVLKNFAIFIGKHLYFVLFVGKAAGWTPATILNERILMSCEF